VTATDSTEGTWYYADDGGASWQTVGGVGDTNALLLAETDRLAFEPDLDYTGTITDALAGRVWDQTTGTAGTTVDVSNNGGTTAFAADTATAAVTVQDAPEVVAIVRASGESNPTNADSVDYTVTFTEPVDGVGPGDFSIIQVSGDVGGSVTGVDGSGASYTVTVGGVTGDGDLRLDLVDDDSITNGNGVPLGGVGTTDAGDGSYTGGETFTLDNTEPGFTSSTTGSIDENTTGPVLDVEAGDDGTAGPETNVTYTLGSAVGGDADGFVVNAGTGQLGLGKAKDFESPEDSDTDNDYLLTVTATDDVGNVGTQTVTVAITDVNEAPTLDTNGGATVGEGSVVRITNDDLASSDPEADTLTYSVTTGVSRGTLFVDGSGSGSDDGTLDGESAVGTGTFTQASIDDGTLLYDHDGSETTEDGFDFDVSDGNGHTLTSNTFSLRVGSINEAPTLSVSTSDPTFTEGGGAVEPFSEASIDVVEDGQLVRRLVVEVTNVTDGPDERLTVDRGDVALLDGNSLVTENDGVSVSVSVSEGTATVTVGGTFSETTASGIVDTLAYRHTGDDPSTDDDRTITVVEVADDGGTTNGGDDTGRFSQSARVSLTSVNAAPTAIDLSSTDVAHSGGTDAVVGRLSATDLDDDRHTFSLVGVDGDDGGAGFVVDDDLLRVGDASTLAEGSYDVRLGAEDGNGGAVESQVTVGVTDDLAPTIVSSALDDVTELGGRTTLTSTFSEDIALGSGSITVRVNDDGFSDWETFDASTGAGSGDGTVSVAGRDLTITPTDGLASSTEYAVRIDPGALTDTAASPNDFGGVDDDTTVRFTTTDSTLPTALVGPDTTVDEGEPVRFDGTGSTDDIGIVRYEWDFDDGETASGATATHTFDDPGVYDVELTVADAVNNEATAVRTITVEPAEGGDESGGRTDTDRESNRPASVGGGGSGPASAEGGSDGPADTTGEQPSTDDGTDRVVTGSRVDDDTVRFGVADPDNDGPITLDVRGTVSDGTPSAGGSDGTDADGGVSDTATAGLDSLSISPAEGAPREFDITVREREVGIDAQEPGNGGDAGADATAATDRGTDARVFLDATGAVPVNTVEVAHTNPDTDIESVTFRFRVRKGYADGRGLDTGAIALYRDGPDGWTRLPTRLVGENGGYHVFESTSPGLSLFTIGSTEPVFVVERAGSPSETFATSEQVTADVTVRNLGGAAGTYTAELRADGTVVATRAIELASRSTRTVSLSFTTTTPGEYTLAVGEVAAGTVSVQPDETPDGPTPAPAGQEGTRQPPETAGDTQPAVGGGDTESTTGTGVPLGILVAAGTLLVVVVVLIRRRS
jgi:hypothetical protein